MEKYCDACGFKAIPTMKICPSCGNRIFIDSPQPVPRANSIFQSANNNPVLSQQKHILFKGVNGNALKNSIFIPAGHWRRIFAILIDMIAMMVGICIIYGLVGLTAIGGAFGKPTGLAGALLLLSTLALPHLYFTLLHSSKEGATWGKMVVGIKVTTLAGEKLTKTQAFVRALLTLIIPMAGYAALGISMLGFISSQNEEIKESAMIAVGIGVIMIGYGPYLTVFFNKQRQTLFDIMCKTCVVMKD